jgi:signal transduction histidine kinase/CheY-like chemotaxis protein
VGVLPWHARGWPLIGWALALLWWCTPADTGLARPWLDQQLRWLAPASPPQGVLVVDIDEASLAELQPIVGTWPYGRDVHAATLRWLRERGVAAVAFDLVLADALRGDAALAAELQVAGAPVVLAVAGQGGVAAATVEPASPATTLATAHRAMPAHAWPAMTLPNLALRSPGPTRLGVITTPLDRDGMLRSLPLWHSAPGLAAPLPVMPLALWQAAAATRGGSAAGAGAPAGDPASASLPPGVRADARGHVAFALGHPRSAPPVLAYAPLVRAALGADAEPAWASMLRGQVVLVGSSSLLADRVMTPGGQREGTVVLAEAYAALRDGRTLMPRQLGWEALLLLLAAVPALVAARRGWASLRRDAAASAVLLALLAGAVLAAGVLLRLPTPTLAPALALLLAGLGSVAWRQAALKAEATRAAYEQAVAEATERTKAEFLANVSHEIRTPLNGLLGVAELLERTPLNDEQRRHVALFRDSGRSLQALIDDLLDLSKIEAGGFSLHPAPFAPLLLLEQVLRLMRPRAEAKGLVLNLELEPESAGALPAGVRGDRQRLEQVLLNLVGNAIKFTTEGSVTLAARPLLPEGLEITVRDTGIGIAASKHERVFEPFAQADGSITRHYGGTGLGLAIVRRLVGLMGGTVQLESAPGRGSRFTLRLPLPACALAVEAPAGPSAHEGGGPDMARPAPLAATAPHRCRVLLAEDNEVNVYIFTAMLRAPEFEVEVADNGVGALELARRGGFDIGFIDLMMPAMDGLTLARELRRWEAGDSDGDAGGAGSVRPRLPLVALTARAFDSDVAASLEAGFDRHLGKPFARTDLLRAVDELARRTAGAVPAPAAQRPNPAVAAAGSAPDPRLEHARQFLLHFDSEYGAALARGDTPQARALASDLVGVAAVVGDPALAAAARSAQADAGTGDDTHAALRRAVVDAIRAQSGPR